MEMSNCILCWNTPCTCGYEYREYTKDARIHLASAVLGIPEANIRKFGKELEIQEKQPMKGLTTKGEK